MATIREVIFVVALWAMLYSPLGALAQAAPPLRKIRPYFKIDVVREMRPTGYLSGEIKRLPPVREANQARVEPLFLEQQETLEDAWRIAAAADRQLKAGQWRVSSAREKLQAAGAQRWPGVFAESSYVGRSAERSFAFNVPGLALPSNRFPFAQNEGATFRTAIEVPLYTGGSISADIQAAHARISAASLNVAESRNDLRLRVAEAYVAVLRTQRAVEVAEKTEDSLRSHAADVQLLHRQKQVPRQDLLAADVALLDARQNVIRARNKLDLSSAAYNRTLTRPLTTPVRLAELPISNTQYNVVQLSQQAISTRPVVAQYMANIAELEHRAASLQGTKRPQIALRGNYALTENRYQNPQGIATIGVGLEWNIYDHGRVRHEAEALTQQAESLRWMLADLKSKITLQVRQAWLDIQETRRRLEVTPEASRQADENLRVAKNRYAFGAAIGTEVLDAEAQRVQAYTNHSNTIYDAVMAEIRLHHAVGAMP